MPGKLKSQVNKILNKVVGRMSLFYNVYPEYVEMRSQEVLDRLEKHRQISIRITGIFNSSEIGGPDGTTQDNP